MGRALTHHRARGLMLPGEADWEYWIFPPKTPPRRASREEFLKARPTVAALPSRNFLVCAFWIPSQANFQQLCELEFSARHLIRRGQPVEALVLERQTDRVLVLGVAPSDDSELPAEAKGAARIEAPARLWNAQGAAGLVWREFGEICVALLRGSQPVYFWATGEKQLGWELAQHIERAAQRLQAEEVMESVPQSFLLLGTFHETEIQALREATGAEIQQAQEDRIPQLGEESADFPPREIQSFRQARSRAQKRLTLAIAGIVIYLGIVTGLGGVLLLGEQKARKAQAEAQTLEPEALAAKEAVNRWSILRPAIDSGSFALDLLAAVAAALPSESVRFTRCAIGSGKIELAGEAADVSQTYELLEKLKNSPVLIEYDWTAAPPEIAGREIVRFEIQGRRADARADTD